MRRHHASDGTSNQQDHKSSNVCSQPSVRLFDRIQRYHSHHKKCEEQYVKFHTCQAERHLHIQQLQLQKDHANKMLIKVQYKDRKKYIKLQAADYEEFISEVREEFSILVDKICVEDDSGTEVDESVFADLAPQNGICFIIQDGDNNDSGASVSPLSTPSIIGGSFLSVSSGSSDCEARPVKRKRSDEDASQSSLSN